MNLILNLFHCSNKYESPIKTIVSLEKNININENDFISIEIKSSTPLDSSCSLWLSDYKFNLTLMDQTFLEYSYGVDLNTYFDLNEAVKFSHNFSIDNHRRTLFKIFLNFYGECSVEIEGASIINEFTSIGTINVSSEKISEIDGLLEYLLYKEHYYWNSVSLTKIPASEQLKDDQNILWTIRRLEASILTFNRNVLPHLSESIGKLVPKYQVDSFKDTSIVSEESILWLIENSNVLNPYTLSDNNSIIVLNRQYTLNELLIQSLKLDTDVVENQIIHGYFSDVYRFLLQSNAIIDKVLIDLKLYSDFKSNIYKSYYERLKFTISSLQLNIEGIKFILNSLIPVKKEHLNLGLSNRFHSKQHYYESYLMISDWINRKEVTFSDVELFSGAKDISKLYEIFCLFKIMDTLTNDFGYILELALDPIVDQEKTYNTWMDKTNNIKSKYSFYNPNTLKRINLFYELLPEELITVAKGIKRGYKPDYIIEIISKDNPIRYIILDAKYKKIITIKNYDFQELALKYLHGIGLKCGGYFPVIGLFIIIPIDQSGIAYYQKHSSYQQLATSNLPLIGRVEIGTSSNQYNYFKDLITHLFNEF